MRGVWTMTECRDQRLDPREKPKVCPIGLQGNATKLGAETEPPESVSGRNGQDLGCGNTEVLHVILGQLNSFICNRRKKRCEPGSAACADHISGLQQGPM